MHREAFPACDVSGPVDPVPYDGHGFAGAIPRKCASCPFLFEGSCTRAGDAGFRKLDHGPCSVPGSTRPILPTNRYFWSKVEIPEKCGGCRYLELDTIGGFVCRQDRHLW